MLPIRHIGRRFYSSIRGLIGSGNVETRFNIGAARIEPNFLYSITNMQFSLDYQRLQTDAYIGVPNLYFFFSRVELHASEIINNLITSTPFSGYAYNGSVANPDVAINPADIYFPAPEGIIAGTPGTLGSDNMIYLYDGSGYPRFADTKSILIFSTSVTGNLITGPAASVFPSGAIYQSINNFSFHSGQYQNIYWCVFYERVDQETFLVSGEQRVQGTVNFDLIQRSPEAS